MKHVCSTPEESLRVVRSLSENAVSRPWDRTLRCATWPRPVRPARTGPFEPGQWRDERPPRVDEPVLPAAAESLESILAAHPRRAFFSM